MPVQYGKDESITIKTHDGLTLEGFLNHPTGELRGAALLFSGSGATTENGDVSSSFVGFGYLGQPARLNWQLRDLLSSAGFATLRYSKRTLSTQSISNLVADARVALKCLQESFPNQPISLIGFSEGAVVATLIAKQIPIHSLHLISVPLRPIDECFQYQFVEWGLKLLEQKVDRDGDGFLSLSDFFRLDLMVLPGAGLPVADLSWNSNECISIQKSIRPVYQHLYQQLRGLLQTPDLKTWHESMCALPDLRKILAQLTCKIHFYQGMADSQINPEWLTHDHAVGNIRGEIWTHPELGHALAPLTGLVGEQKTSGPFSESFLTQLRLRMESTHI